MIRFVLIVTARRDSVVEFTVGSPSGMSCAGAYLGPRLAQWASVRKFMKLHSQVMYFRVKPARFSCPTVQ